MKVDLVYTWVTGKDDQFIEEWRSFAETPKDVNPERFRDLYDLLKYSLRSVEKYLPWFNKIYLVTKKPQVPVWLNTHHPKIEIVHHDQIMDADILPTFNPNVIESYLHKIPGLEEHFLYINDDFLFGSLYAQW